MSVIVKGMEMPDSCGACKLSVQVSMSLGAVMRCRLVGVVGTSFSDPHDVLNKRHPNCPLVALPDKHGRLVDADEIKNKNPLHMELDVPYVTEVTVGEIIDSAPTIVESEDES